MLRDSPLEGFGVKNGLEIKRLITTLYADDTTVFLSERDHLKTLQEIIQKWCKVSGAKFNENKTIILPTGTPEYRARVVATRKHNPNDPIIPENIIIAQDGRPVRILGSFLGNAIEQSGIWTPIIEKIDDQLEKWNRSHPTQEGKRLIINMEVGGRTQYLTRVQGMPSDIEKTLKQKITKFIWDGKSPMINIDTLQKPVKEGGKSVLCLEARNEAIELMKTQRYLMLGEERPDWALIADELLADEIPKDKRVISEEAKQNVFLQNWTIKIKGAKNLPPSLKSMIKIANKYNVEIDPPVVNDSIKEIMPIWNHKGFDPKKRVIMNGKWSKCQRVNHRIITTGDMKRHTKPFPPNHKKKPDCICEVCVDAQCDGCEYPEYCIQAGRKLLDCLKPKWDPRRKDTLEINDEDQTGNGNPKRTEKTKTFNTLLGNTTKISGEIRVFGEKTSDRTDPKPPNPR